MRHGKDFLSDKPAITTLEQLAEVRKAVAETGRMFAIMYSERLEVKAAVKAGELVKAGAIGKVVQTVNIAPHQIQGARHAAAGLVLGARPLRRHPLRHRLAPGRPVRVLHRLHDAEVVASQVANVRHPDHPKFQDFGDMMLRGNGGFGYVRVDWFTPDGLGTWGDGRLFILGTDGYIELRKYADIAGRKAATTSLSWIRSRQRYIDCNNVALPFGPQFVADIVNRTHVRAGPGPRPCWPPNSC